VKSPLHDPYWHCLPRGGGAPHDWLHDRGSLTSRIEARCASFSVRVVFQGLRRVNRDERFLIAGGRRARALVREVYLYCGRTPVVFAHSVIAPRALDGEWRRLAGLGNRPLGAALFADPRIRRYPLRQKRLDRRHELYRRACAALPSPPAHLWARRSLFALRGSPILVTEIFLPGIRRLRK
jgi:chorismate--pyruvate lyase